MIEWLPSGYWNVFLFLIKKRWVSYNILENTDNFCKIQLSYKWEIIESIYNFTEKDNWYWYRHNPMYVMFYKALRKWVHILNNKFKFITDFNF